jgi:hypothetical protein
MITDRLLKNSAGRRCDQKALPQCFLAQPDGQHGQGRVLRGSTVFQQSENISGHPRLKKVFGSISVLGDLPFVAPRAK